MNRQTWLKHLDSLPRSLFTKWSTYPAGLLHREPHRSLLNSHVLLSLSKSLPQKSQRCVPRNTHSEGKGRSRTQTPQTFKTHTHQAKARPTHPQGSGPPEPGELAELPALVYLLNYRHERPDQAMSSYVKKYLGSTNAQSINEIIIESVA